MQPVDFEEELARSTERVNKKKKRLELMDRMKSGENTPYSSPRLGSILVQDTQPRSPVSLIKLISEKKIRASLPAHSVYLLYRLVNLEEYCNVFIG